MFYACIFYHSSGKSGLIMIVERGIQVSERNFEEWRRHHGSCAGTRRGLLVVVTTLKRVRKGWLESISQQNKK